MRGEILARRYAKALLELGLEEKALDRIGEEMARLAQTFKEEPVLLTYLSLREAKGEKKKNILAGLQKALLLSPWIHNLLTLLLKGRRIQIFPTIAKVFEALVREEEGRVVAKIETAEKKSIEGLKEELKKSLEKLTRKKVDLKIEENRQLIGGLRVSIGDTIYDASLAGELERIKEAFYGN